LRSRAAAPARRLHAHCQRELSARELSELSEALERGLIADGVIALDSAVSEHVASTARPLVDFIASAESSASRAALVEEAAIRLRSAVAGRRTRI
jgi:hypothetical protein